MAGASRTLTIKFVGDSKNANRAVKDLVSSMDDTESAGRRVAKAIGILSDDAETGFRDAKDAADKLAQAVGADAVTEIQAAGRSIEGYVQDLKGMGLTYDDVRTDVDDLADAIRKIEATKSAIDGPKIATANLGDEAQIAAGKVDGLRDNSDQARGVLGSMVGGSAADLLGLGGVAGTAASAIDQMASYAVEGSLNLKDIAKLVGPMAGVGVAVMGVTWAVGKLQEGSKKAEQAGKDMLAVQEDLADGSYEAAALGLQEAWGGTIGELTDMGFTVEEVIGHLTGQKSITEELDAVIDAQGKTVSGNVQELEAHIASSKRLKQNLGLATTAFEDQGVALTETTTQTNAIEAALGVLIATNDAAATSFETVDRSAEDFADEIKRAEDETRLLMKAYEELTGELSAEEAWISAQESMIQFREDMKSGELSVLEQKQALIDVKGSLVDYLTSLEGVPAEKQTEILALIDQGKVEEASRQLDILARARGVQVYIAGGMGAGIKYSAAGNPLAAGEPSVVGDNPNGTWNSTTELFVPSVSGRILSAADSRAAVAGMGGGGTVVNVNVSATPLASPADIGRAVREALLADARTSGPVFQTVRR
jgi:archaellum component FlaC